MNDSTNAMEPVPAERLPAMKTGSKVAAIIPHDSDEAKRVAGIICGAGIAPKGMDRNQVLISILAGMEVGLPPIQAVSSIMVVNNRPQIWGDGALALVRGSGLLEDFDERIAGEGDGRVATCFARRVGQESEIIKTFSVADARNAGLWQRNEIWKKYPDRMLQMRARAFALRDGFADVLRGVGIREEVRDMNLPPMPRAQPLSKADLLGKPEPEVIEAEPEDLPEAMEPEETLL